MMWLGLTMVLLGFVLVTPRGATPGSVSRRIVQMPAGSFFTTAGYQDQPGPKTRAKRMGVGVALLVAGVSVLWFAI